ncbi:hypothetical protein HOG98_05490 [bacterium]|jgi:hypothetical protein|nr:hypothetical protein [bacterium]
MLGNNTPKVSMILSASTQNTMSANSTKKNQEVIGLMINQKFLTLSEAQQLVDSKGDSKKIVKALKTTLSALRKSGNTVSQSNDGMKIGNSLSIKKISVEEEVVTKKKKLFFGLIPWNKKIATIQQFSEIENNFHKSIKLYNSDDNESKLDIRTHLTNLREKAASDSKFKLGYTAAKKQISGLSTEQKESLYANFSTLQVKELISAFITDGASLLSSELTQNEMLLSELIDADPNKFIEAMNSVDDTISIDDLTIGLLNIRSKCSLDVSTNGKNIIDQTISSHRLKLQNKGWKSEGITSFSQSGQDIPRISNNAVLLKEGATSPLSISTHQGTTKLTAPALNFYNLLTNSMEQISGTKKTDLLKLVLSSYSSEDLTNAETIKKLFNNQNKNGEPFTTKNGPLFDHRMQKFLKSFTQNQVGDQSSTLIAGFGLKLGISLHETKPTEPPYSVTFKADGKIDIIYHQSLTNQRIGASDNDPTKKMSLDFKTKLTIDVDSEDPPIIGSEISNLHLDRLDELTHPDSMSFANELLSQTAITGDISVKINAMNSVANAETALESLFEVQSGMDTLEINFITTQINNYREILSPGNFVSINSIDKATTAMESKNETAKQTYIDQKDRNFEVLKGKLKNLVQIQNNLKKEISELKRLNPIDKAESDAIAILEKKVIKIEESLIKLSGLQDATTNSQRLDEFKLSSFKAEVTKLIDVKKKEYGLLFQDPSITNKTAKTKEDKKVFSSLKESPFLNDDGHLDEPKIKEHLLPLTNELEENYEAINPKLMKAKMKEISTHFSWGASHTNLSLTATENWTPIQRFAVKTSKSDQTYISITEMTPLHEGPGVPAGLRDHEDFKERTTNFFQTNHYILGQEETSEQLSFRGGQFPTVNAAKSAMLTMMSLTKSNDFHINVLLTPITPIRPIINKSDKKLLADHKANIMISLREIKAALDTSEKKGTLTPEQENIVNALKFSDYTSEKLNTIIQNLSLANIGVNEGAVGEFETKGLHLPFIKAGWQESAKYLNESFKQTNIKLNALFEKKEDILSKIRNGASLDESEISILKRLPAITQITLDMDQVWASNDYAVASVGNDQFKFAAQAKVLNELLDTVVYEDCMSGKDRTGEVESDAFAMQDEITMNTLEHKEKMKSYLAKHVESISDLRVKDIIENKIYENVELLTSPLFTEKDLDRLFKYETANDFQECVWILTREKVSISQELLTANDKAPNRKGVLRQKEIGHSVFSTTKEISIYTDTSKQSKLGNLVYSFFNRFTAPGPYDSETKSYKMNLKDMKPDEFKKYVSRLKEQHVYAKNRRQSVMGSGSLRITQVNTGATGFKVEGGEPLKLHLSGFNRDYVTHRLMDAAINKKSKEEINALLFDLTGLYELSDADQQKARIVIEKATSELSKSKIPKSISELYKTIEDIKYASTNPKTKVKA